MLSLSLSPVVQFTFIPPDSHHSICNVFVSLSLLPIASFCIEESKATRKIGYQYKRFECFFGVVLPQHRHTHTQHYTVTTGGSSSPGSHHKKKPGQVDAVCLFHAVRLMQMLSACLVRSDDIATIGTVLVVTLCCMCGVCVPCFN